MTEKTLTMETDTNSLCLICLSKTTRQQQDNRDYFHPPNPKLLSKDLGNYFLLRHILNLTSDQIQKYLRYCPCPRDWVKVCSDCSVNYVDKCTRIFLELLELKRSLRAARNELIEAVRRSVERDRRIPAAPSDVLDVPRDVRRLVTQRELDPEPDHSEGDSKAKRMLDYQEGLTENSLVVSIGGGREDVVPEDIKLDIAVAKEEDEEDGLTGPTVENSAFPMDTEFYDESGDWDDDADVETNDKPASDNSKTNSPKKTMTRKRRRRRKESDKTCKYCKKVFTRYPSVTKHVIICPQNPVVARQLKTKKADITQKCDMCGSTVKGDKILEHIQSHVGDFALKCPNKPCPYVFSNSRPIQLHLRTQCKFGTDTVIKSTSKETNTTTPSSKPSPLQTYMYTCETCGFESDRRLVFQTHLEQMYERSSKKNYTCPVAECEESFTVRQSVDLHLSAHMLRETIFQNCHLCSVRFKVGKMKDHLTGFHKMEETFPCPHCPFLFSAKAYMVEHLHKHRQHGFSCDICGRDVNFILHRDLRKHYEKEHQVDFTHLTCQTCGFIGSRKRALQHHIKMEHAGENSTEKTIKKINKAEGKGAKNVPCDLCLDSSVLYYKRTLVTHKVKEHGLEPLQCKKCGKQYASIQGLELHERKEHIGLKERPCPVPGCGKVFNTEQKLKAHARYVHRERRHVCSECGKQFRTSTKLRGHYNTVHLGTRSHVCEICGKSFKTVPMLREHVTMHTGETPYQCSTCGQSFRLRTSFTRHAKVHVRMGANYKPRGPKPGHRKKEGGESK